MLPRRSGGWRLKKDACSLWEGEAEIGQGVGSGAVLSWNYDGLKVNSWSAFERHFRRTR